MLRRFAFILGLILVVGGVSGLVMCGVSLAQGQPVRQSQIQPPPDIPQPQSTTVDDLFGKIGKCQVQSESQAVYIETLKQEVLKLGAEVASLKKKLDDRPVVVEPSTN